MNLHRKGPRILGSLNQSLLQVGLVDENDLAYTLSMEKQTQDLIDAGQMYEAWES